MIHQAYIKYEDGELIKSVVVLTKLAGLPMYEETQYFDADSTQKFKEKGAFALFLIV